MCTWPTSSNDLHKFNLPIKTLHLRFYFKQIIFSTYVSSIRIKVLNKNSYKNKNSLKQKQLYKAKTASENWLDELNC